MPVDADAGRGGITQSARWEVGVDAMVGASGARRLASTPDLA
jgi:hypothetical protein